MHPSSRRARCDLVTAQATNSNSHPQLDLAVVIPAYNAQDVIDRAIQSARRSGAESVIVVDDGSADATREVAERAGAHCIVQENAGAARARERGAAAVTSKYVVFLDADDELVPDGVRGSVAVLEADDALAVSAGTLIGVGEQREVAFPIRYSPVNSTSLLVEGYGPWPPAAAVVRYSSYVLAREVQPAALRPRYAEDYELLIRLSLVGAIDVREEATARYSLAGGKSAQSAGSAIESKEAIRRHYADFLGIHIEAMSEREVQMAALVRSARGQWASGQRAAAFRTMLKWVGKDPAYSFRKLSSAPWKRN
ncbi:glycosyltransferase family 2 protein [Agromyces atrinae]|uniref:glycosyltransferase family A protein n=1 Tax=Agromyces atrinae TaxID=592376 RepID=UPI001F57E987|nr:glycosyltransferase family 2 protein [Agromyces atrinae]MCI2956078.1 glycosyltransferase family 2 protein [Agromyces atrinae]